MVPFRACRALVVLSILVPAAAHAGPPAPPPVKASAPKPAAGAVAVKRTAHLAPAGNGPQRQAPGRSVGSPTEGHLVGGAHLAEAPHLRIVPTYSGGDVRWGVEPLVGMIDRAARSVRKQFPDAVLSVGHLSKPGGGELDRHASHESGRDADIGFYVKNQAGKPVYENSFVAFLGDGTAPSWPGARFDDARNWALVASFVNDPQAHVTHIFVATPLRARLLSYADKIGASPATRNRAAELMAQPKGSLPHDDHFHVRIACPSGMDKCVEVPTARHHRARSHTAIASSHAHAVPAHKAPVAAAPIAKPAAPAKPASPAKPAPIAPDAQAKSETSMPSLAPEVPGLDAAVIATPISGLKLEPKAEAPKADPIDDPDGVLESH